MNHESEPRSVSDVLGMADLTVHWLDQMALIVSQYGDSSADHEVESTERCLMVANAALRRWRLEIGLNEGVWSLNEAEGLIKGSRP